MGKHEKKSVYIWRGEIKLIQRIIKILVKEISIFAMGLASLGLLRLILQSLTLHKLCQKESSYSKWSCSS